MRITLPWHAYIVLQYYYAKTLGSEVRSIIWFVDLFTECSIAEGAIPYTVNKSIPLVFFRILR